ncbi:MAG TPA: HdeD family acid-resistance protein [Fimbriiglobus sp.]|jgi:uncharacterized membrane protein HdeD (DUF308 family)
MAAPLPYFLSTITEELQAIRRNWFWFLVLGIGLVVIGFVAIAYPLLATATTVKLFGVLMLVGGAMEIVSGLWTRRWGGFFAHLLCGLLYLFVGTVFLERTFSSAAGLTLLLAMFFFAAGIFRIVFAVGQRFSGWGWMAFSGFISLLLAFMIWQNFFTAVFGLIGTLVGIELVFNGWSWVMLGLAAKSIPETGSPPPATPVA